MPAQPDRLAPGHLRCLPGGRRGRNPPGLPGGSPGVSVDLDAVQVIGPGCRGLRSSWHRVQEPADPERFDMLACGPVALVTPDVVAAVAMVPVLVLSDVVLGPFGLPQPIGPAVQL